MHAITAPGFTQPARVDRPFADDIELFNKDSP